LSHFTVFYLLEEVQSHVGLLLLEHVKSVADVILLVQHEELALLSTDDRHRARRVVLNALRRYLLHTRQSQAPDFVPGAASW